MDQGPGQARTGRPLTLWQSPGSRLVSNPGESEADFRVRAAQSGREARDAAVEALRAKYAPKLAQLQERLRKADERAGMQQAQARQAQLETAVNVGAGLLGALFGGGRRGGIGSAVGRAGRSAGKAYRESQDVGAAADSADVVRVQMAELEAQAQAEAATLSGAGPETLTALTVKPKSTDVNVRLVALVWCPFETDASGQLQPAWE